MKSICIISHRYPDKRTPTVHVFVRKLAWAMADRGIKVTVIAPIPIQEKNKELSPYYSIDKSELGSAINVYRPKCLYFGNQVWGKLRTGSFSVRYMQEAVERVMRRENLIPDALYGHFICPSGLCACRIGKSKGIPAFIGFGESSDRPLDNYGLQRIRNETDGCGGFIAVSEYNRTRLLNLGIGTEDSVKTFVNGIDPGLFHPGSKVYGRKKWMIPEDDFVVSFVGQFSERKGVSRLIEAVRGLDEVKLVLAGSGPIQIDESDQILFKGRIEPKEIPDFLRMSDVFVLPTRLEGCPNAVLEAMGCGLPIVTSDLPFNHDILNKESAILVNPDSVEEIRSAIMKLYQSPELREQLAKASKSRAKRFSIQERTKNICKWIEERRTALDRCSAEG